MMKLLLLPSSTACLLLSLISDYFLLRTHAFSTVSRSSHHAAKSGHTSSSELGAENRRLFLKNSLVWIPILTSTVARAEEEDVQDMTKMLFNPDGSLKKSDMRVEAKFRDVAFSWDVVEESYNINVDGSNLPDTKTGSSVNIQYQLPDKWKDGYIDTSEGKDVKACNRIIVYQSPKSGSGLEDRLKKASGIGIAKALFVIDELKELERADLISGRVTTRDSQKFYDFDMAVAPQTCPSSSSENLGLGFCPYDSITLLSATVFADRLYVFAIQCDKDEWKQANADLRRVRSSFSVSSV